MSLPVIYRGNEGEQYNTYTTAQFEVGSVLGLGPDARTFRFIFNEDVALEAGRLMQAKVADDQFLGMAVAAAGAVGDNSFTFVNGTTTIAADELAGGYVTVYEVAQNTDAAAASHCYRIFSHTSGVSGDTITLTLDPNVKLQRAITTSTDVDAVFNLYNDVIISTGVAPTAALIGVSISDIGTDEYGWIQTSGVCGIFVDDAATLDAGDALAAGIDPGSIVEASTAALADFGICLMNTPIDDAALCRINFE